MPQFDLNSLPTTSVLTIDDELPLPNELVWVLINWKFVHTKFLVEVAHTGIFTQIEDVNMVTSTQGVPKFLVGIDYVDWRNTDIHKYIDGEYAIIAPTSTLKLKWRDSKLSLLYVDIREFQTCQWATNYDLDPEYQIQIRDKQAYSINNRLFFND